MDVGLYEGSTQTFSETVARDRIDERQPPAECEDIGCVAKSGEQPLTISPDRIDGSCLARVTE